MIGNKKFGDAINRSPHTYRTQGAEKKNHFPNQTTAQKYRVEKIELIDFQ